MSKKTGQDKKFTPPLRQFMHGDCVELMESLAPGSVHCIFADPPYNLQLRGTLKRPDETEVDAVDDTWDKFDTPKAYDAFTRRWLESARRVLHKDGTIWVMGSYHNIFRVGNIMQDMGFWTLNDIVWVKSNPMPNFRGRRFTNAHETLLWCAKDSKSRHTFNYQAMKSLNDDRQLRSEWYLPICSGNERLRTGSGEKVHSTQKPEALLRRALLASTNPGDVVLDPFGGTGTTAAVAAQLGRGFIYMDNHEPYYRVALERLASVGQLPPEALAYTVEKTKEPRIPFGYFVEQGFIPAGSKLVHLGSGVEATVVVDGSLHSVIQSGETVTGSIHKVGAKVAGTETCNGWTFWSQRREDGTTVLIDAIRQEEISRRKAEQKVEPSTTAESESKE